MSDFKYTLKYEVVIGLNCEPSDGTRGYIILSESVRCAWQRYAKDFYDETGMYVSAISVFGYALYHTDWGCPYEGEQCLSFHCTANPEFVHDFELYEKGILYIAKKLKKEFEQHTITITKLNANICYLTDKEEE